MLPQTQIFSNGKLKKSIDIKGFDIYLLIQYIYISIEQRGRRDVFE